MMSLPLMLDVGLNTATNVKPLFVAIFKVCVPPSMNCTEERRKLTCPFPFGPPKALYVGNVPTAALLRFATDVSERRGSMILMNLAQAVLEYGAIKLLPV